MQAGHNLHRQAFPAVEVRHNMAADKQAAGSSPDTEAEPEQQQAVPDTAAGQELQQAVPDTEAEPELQQAEPDTAAGQEYQLKTGFDPVRNMAQRQAGLQAQPELPAVPVAGLEPELPQRAQVVPQAELQRYHLQAVHRASHLLSANYHQNHSLIISPLKRLKFIL